MAYIDSESDVIDLTLDSDTDESATNVPSLKKLKRYKMPDMRSIIVRTCTRSLRTLQVPDYTGAAVTMKKL